ncbi:hypothetical protein Nepgr_012218 [Nepenthes gracilis]|uniref:Uncharacterized protein n=1 Tax=Nepenthes gracilis TaxID=150966 RepID=A0AAD3XMM1_NEPGR|nr:hypothetical protein Nepgr_012218 [Nepenthes gracilis]
MAERVEPVFLWVEEPKGEFFVTERTKRKIRPRKKEFSGWGSKPLIEFLESIGKETSKALSQRDVTSMIDHYVHENNLIHPLKKKRILCDVRLHSLFGRKSVSRLKIYELLERHFTENQEESEGEEKSNSELKEDTFTNCKQQNTSSSDRKSYHKKKAAEVPKSSFASIISENIKLIYLKRSLIQDLLKDPETFDSKLLGSFVRIKSDPYDYFQRNSHQLQLVTGVKRASEAGDSSSDMLLEVSNMTNAISLSALSDDNFSQEECKDLYQRMKEGLLKQPTVGQLEQKAQVLHEDITKHWIVRELEVLKNLIDQANEKGWRKYLERRKLLETPAEQSRLLLKIPKVIAEEAKQEAPVEDTCHLVTGANDDPSKSIVRESPCNLPSDEAMKTRVSIELDVTVAEPIPIQAERNGHLQSSNPNEENLQQTAIKKIEQAQVIELSDDDGEDENPSSRSQIPHILPEQIVWHYVDPQGETQGPFSLIQLKRWSPYYFPPDFKVWKTGQSQDKEALLTDVLEKMLPN